MKKILFVTASTKGGGAERMLINIINSLADKRDYKLRLINTGYEDIPFTLNKSVETKTLFRKTSKESFFSLIKEIKQFKPKYIFTTSSTLGYLLVLLKILFFPQLKVFIRVAVPPSESVLKGIKSNLLTSLSRLLYRKADLIIAQTQYMKDDLCNHYHLDKSIIRVIRNIVDENLINSIAGNNCPIEFNHNEYNIVASGALYSVKGFDMLIRSFSEVSKSISNLHLYILGEERYEVGYKNYLLNIIDDLDLGDKVKLLGYKENPFSYYKYADLFVLSSIHEGYPNVVLESLTLGTPVVVTECVDFSDVINESNGLVVPINSQNDMKNAIIYANSFFGKKKIQYKPLNFDYSTLFI